MLLEIKSQILEGTESRFFDRGNEPLRESLSLSNILDDFFKLLFRVHVELHPRLHSGKLKEKEQGVKCACICEVTAWGREQREAPADRTAVPSRRPDLPAQQDHSTP